MDDTVQSVQLFFHVLNYPSDNWIILRVLQVRRVLRARRTNNLESFPIIFMILSLPGPARRSVEIYIPLNRDLIIPNFSSNA